MTVVVPTTFLGVSSTSSVSSGKLSGRMKSLILFPLRVRWSINIGFLRFSVSLTDFK